jgi:hypothetical protein
MIDVLSIALPELVTTPASSPKTIRGAHAAMLGRPKTVLYWRSSASWSVGAGVSKARLRNAGAASLSRRISRLIAITNGVRLKLPKVAKI